MTQRKDPLSAKGGGGTGIPRKLSYEDLLFELREALEFRRNDQHAPAEFNEES